MDDTKTIGIDEAKSLIAEDIQNANRETVSDVWSAMYGSPAIIEDSDASNHFETPPNPYYYTLAELKARETIRSGQYDNLKIDDGTVRVWLSRCGVADGLPYDNGVTVDVLESGVWATVVEYEAVDHDECDYRCKCGICGKSWCDTCDPAPSALCHYCHGRGYSTAPVK